MTLGVTRQPNHGCNMGNNVYTKLTKKKTLIHSDKNHQSKVVGKPELNEAS